VRANQNQQLITSYRRYLAHSQMVRPVSNTRNRTCHVRPPTHIDQIYNPGKTSGCVGLINVLKSLEFGWRLKAVRLAELDQ